MKGLKQFERRKRSRKESGAARKKGKDEYKYGRHLSFLPKVEGDTVQGDGNCPMPLVHENEHCVADVSDSSFGSTIPESAVELSAREAVNSHILNVIVSQDNWLKVCKLSFSYDLVLKVGFLLPRIYYTLFQPAPQFDLDREISGSSNRSPLSPHGKSTPLHDVTNLV